MDKYYSTGDWNELDIGSSTCKVQKTSSATTITFTLTAIKKKATITLGVSSSTEVLTDTGETETEEYSTAISQATVGACFLFY